MSYEWVSQIGYIGIAIITFIETGTIAGIILPFGIPYLLTIGILAHQGLLNVWLASSLILFIGFFGSIVAYKTGQKYGRSLFMRNTKVLNEKNLIKLEDLFNKYNNQLLVFARFLPFIGILVGMFAGMVNMNIKKFYLFNSIGLLLYNSTFIFAGYYFTEWITQTFPFLFL